MRLRIALYTVLTLALAGGLVACADRPDTAREASTGRLDVPARDTGDALTSVRSAAQALPAQDATRTPEPSPAASRLKVSVWWPDELYPQDQALAETVLLSQFDGFQLAYNTYDLEVRRKRANGVGGILPTLRAAFPVAPGALPDLTLMRRSDMVTAANEGLIVPLADLVPDDLVDSNLLPGARTLGEINGTLYGVPYALTLYHVVYRTSLYDTPLLTFDDVLEAAPRYLFPAGAGSGSVVGWTALVQYLAAGGRLVDDLGNAALDREAMLTVLDYYERGLEAGMFGPALADYTAPVDYWNEFVAGEADMVSVDSSTYLAHKDSVPGVGLAPIPTADGLALTLMDGWLWVITTHDPDRQRQARAFLSWMMRVNQQSFFSEAMDVLPSQARALRLWDDETYAEFARSLAADARVVPPAQRNNSAAQAFQESVKAVLNGTAAEVAADTALGQLSQGQSSSNRATVQNVSE
jgi:ABC-type glycerol-3-phosphate transport system substrate-binding protein